MSDCLPEPPTPTSIAEPRGAVRMRARRQTWSMASGKKTSGIGPIELPVLVEVGREQRRERRGARATAAYS